MKDLVEGRIVHYVLPNGEHRPGIVVRVWPGEFPHNTEDQTGVNLQVFLDGTNDNKIYNGLSFPAKEDQLKGNMWRTSVSYSSVPTPGTWHWIEKAP
jgi:hypothetical protein